MSQIKRMPEEDFGALVTIVANAYPGFKIVSEEDHSKLEQRLLHVQEHDPTVDLYGLYREGQLQGVMRLHDFRMNMRGIPIKAGGVGLIAVDLMHKKEKVGRDIVRFFLEHCRAGGAPMALLYPFRPDFYKDMGFGYGPKMNQYRIRPTALPRDPSKANVHMLQAEDREALAACYARYMARTHGMMARSEFELDSLFKNRNLRIVAYKQGDSIQGYIFLLFRPAEPESFINNDLHVREFVFETREALSELLSFLHSQADQVNRIVFHTQDPYFHHLLHDPRNDSGLLIPSVYHESNVQGVGLMYRVVDTAGLFQALARHSFGGQNCRLKLCLQDSFFPENAGSTTIHFEEGRPRLQEGGEYDVEIEMDVAEFSSLVMGVVAFKWLYQHNLAQISDPGYLDTVDKIFWTEQLPFCTTPF